MVNKKYNFFFLILILLLFSCLPEKTKKLKEKKQKEYEFSNSKETLTFKARNDIYYQFYFDENKNKYFRVNLKTKFVYFFDNMEHIKYNYFAIEYQYNKIAQTHETYGYIVNKIKIVITVDDNKIPFGLSNNIFNINTNFGN